jgi:hypothetical protein
MPVRARSRTQRRTDPSSASTSTLRGETQSARPAAISVREPSASVIIALAASLETTTRSPSRETATRFAPVTPCATRARSSPPGSARTTTSVPSRRTTRSPAGRTIAIASIGALHSSARLRASNTRTRPRADARGETSSTSALAWGHVRRPASSLSTRVVTRPAARGADVERVMRCHREAIAAWRERRVETLALEVVRLRDVEARTGAPPP